MLPYKWEMLPYKNVQIGNGCSVQVKHGILKYVMILCTIWHGMPNSLLILHARVWAKQTPYLRRISNYMHSVMIPSNDVTY